MCSPVPAFSMYRVWEEEVSLSVIFFLHLLTSVLLTDFSQKLVKKAGTAGTQEREV